jgi:hypothetical protein
LRVVFDCITRRVCRGLEQQQKPVGTTHLAAAMLAEQAACAPVVLGPRAAARTSPNRCVICVLSTTSVNSRAALAAIDILVSMR